MSPPPQRVHMLHITDRPALTCHRHPGAPNIRGSWHCAFCGSHSRAVTRSHLVIMGVSLPSDPLLTLKKECFGVFLKILLGKGNN